MRIVDLTIPLEAFEQLAGLDRDTLGQIFRRVELGPVAFGDERCKSLAYWSLNHGVNVAVGDPVAVVLEHEQALPYVSHYPVRLASKLEAV